MSLKVSSGLSAKAQEWTPSFASGTPSDTTAASGAAAAATPAAAPQPTLLPTDANPAPYAGNYYNNGGAVPGDYYYGAAGEYYYANPWQMATAGQLPQQQQQQQHRKQQQRKNGSQGGKKKRKKKKKKDSSARSEKPSPPGEIVPNRILVFKNLPFSYTVKELEDVIAEHCNLKPETTSFHRDKNGQFKGFCFVYFDSIKSADHVQTSLSGFELQGRKWTIEFKRIIQDDSSTVTLIPTGRPSSSGGNGMSALPSSSMGMGMGASVRSRGGVSSVRDKYRSASESDADMNWRRTKSEADFPPKDEAGHKIYRQMLEFKEKHAALARATRASPSSSSSASSSSSSSTSVSSASASSQAETPSQPQPLIISIAPSQKNLQRLVQECLKRLSLDHRIKDEVGDQVTYEITPRKEVHMGMSGLGMGAASAGEVLNRRRRGVSTGTFEMGHRNGNLDARTVREARRTSGAGYSSSFGRTSGEKTIKAQKYAGLTVSEAAARQLAELRTTPKGERSPPAAIPSLGLMANMPSQRLRTESRDLGARYASGPDGSPGFLSGPRGRIRSPASCNDSMNSSPKS